MKKALFLCDAFAFLAILFAAAVNVSADYVSGTIVTGTNPYAVAVNPMTNKTYVANYGSGNVTVFDGGTNITSTITAGTYPRAIAVNPMTNKVYVANYGSSSVTVIDSTNNKSATVSVTGNPNAIAVNQTTNMIYVTSYNAALVTAIHGGSNETDTINVGAGPMAVCVNPVTNTIYVANSGSNNVTVINGATKQTATVAAGTSPYSIAANTVTNRIYVANNGSNNITVIDGATNQTSSISAGTAPCNVAVNPATGLVYVTNTGSNNVTVIDSANNPISLATGTGPSAIAVNPVKNKIYVTNSGGSSVTVIDGETNTTATLAVGTTPNAIAINTITSTIFAANSGGASVCIIKGLTDSASSSFLLKGTSPAYPLGIAVNTVTNKIYILNSPQGSVMVIDGATNDTNSIPLGVATNRIAINPVTNKVYVASSGAVIKSIIEIDGATNKTSNIATDVYPSDLAVNPVTDKIYVANYFSNHVTVIDGATRQTLNVNVDSFPTFIEVNPVTNKIYVAYSSLRKATVIDGVTNKAMTFTTEGFQSSAIAVNRVTNKIYITSKEGRVVVIDGATDTPTLLDLPVDCSEIAINEVTNKVYIATAEGITIIDGITNQIDTIRMGPRSQIAYFTISLNQIKNRIYVANYGSDTLIVIDGITKKIKNIAVGISPNIAAVNPATDKIYAMANSPNSVIAVIDDEPTADTKIKTSFNLLQKAAVFSSQPAFAGFAVNLQRPGHSGIAGVITSMNTAQSTWSFASIMNGAGTDSVAWQWTWGTDTLLWGENFLCTVAIDSQAASSNNIGLGTSFTGNITVVPVYRIKQLSRPTDTPMQIAPENGAEDQQVPLKFIWRPIAGSTYYTVQIAGDTSFLYPAVTEKMVSDTSLSMNTLSYGGTYYWRVMACNDDGYGPRSAVWKFSMSPLIPAAPPAPLLVAPINGSLGLPVTPTLLWSAAQRAVTYAIQVSSTPDFSLGTINDSEIVSTSYTASGLSAYTLYYWRVRAKNAGGSSGWSAVWNFTSSNTGHVLFGVQSQHVFSAHVSSDMVRYSLPRRCRVSIKLYDLKGRLILSAINKVQESGDYTLFFSTMFIPGVYLMQIEAGTFIRREIVSIAN